MDAFAHHQWAFSPTAIELAQLTMDRKGAFGSVKGA
jgi:hypothetical protein